VHAHKFSKAAQERIEAAGGTCQVIVEAEGGGLPT
jgi:ribosomal protein L15